MPQNADIEIVRNALNGLFSPEGEHDIQECPFCMRRIRDAFKALERLETKLTA